MATMPRPDEAGNNFHERPLTLLTVTAVQKRIPVTKMTLWRWVQAGKFPKPINRTGRNYWRADEIAAWIDGEAA